MAKVELRVRLVGGDLIDLVYEDPATSSTDELVDHVIATLSRNSGVIRCRHGDRLVTVFGRGAAMVEVAPRGAVL